jgi:hypothetical protein
MNTIKDLIAYDYWARFVFLRFNDSPEFPIMDFLIEEVGSNNIETMTTIFTQDVLLSLDLELFLSRNIHFIRNQEYLIWKYDISIVNRIFLVVFRLLYPMYLEVNKMHEKYTIVEINDIFMSYLNTLIQECVAIDISSNGRNSLLSDMEMWKKHPWF